MKSEIKKGAVIGYLSVLVSTFVAIFFTPILIDNLGTSDYGVYTLISSVMAYFGVLDLGLGSTAVRYIAKNQKNKEKVKEINGFLLKIYLVISLIAIVLGLLLFFNASNIFGKLTASEINKFKISLLIMTFTLAMSFPLSVCSSYIMAHEKFIFQKLLALLQSIAKPLFMLPLLLFGYKSIALIVALAVINICTYFANYLYSKIKLGFSFTMKKMKDNKELVKEMFYFSFFILLSMVVDTVFNNTDQVILAATSGTMAVSIYNVSMQFRSTNTNLSSVISQMFYPKLTKMVSEKKSIDEISKIFNSVSRIQLYILMLIFSGFLIFGNSFIKLWVGEDFIHAYYIVLICLLPNLVPLSQNIGIYVLQAMNMHKFRAISFLLIAILNVSITIPLSAKYSGIGAAVGTAIAVLLGQIIAMNYYYSKVVKLDLKTYWINFIKIVLPIGLVSLGLNICLNNLLTSWIKLFAGGVLFLILYLLYIYFVLFNEEEKGMFKGIINKFKRKKSIYNG